MTNLYVIAFVAYVLGTAVGAYFGRRWGINVGSLLTFDLFVRLGYVKYHIDGQGEVVLEKVGPGSGD